MATGHCKLCDKPEYPLKRHLCNTCYQRERRKPEWRTSHVDAEPTRIHIEALRARGMGSRTIAKLARVDRGMILNITNGRMGTGKTHSGPAKKIMTKTARAILAIPLPDWNDPAVAEAVVHRNTVINALRAIQKVPDEPRPPLRLYSPDDPKHPGNRKQSWIERYNELTELGYRDIDIWRRSGSTVMAFVRQMDRYKLPVSAPMAAEIQLMRRRKGYASGLFKNQRQQRKIEQQQRETQGTWNPPASKEIAS